MSDHATCWRCRRQVPTEEMIDVSGILTCEPCTVELGRAEQRSDSIDAAWVAAEGALPKGWAVTGLTQYEGTWGAFATAAGASGIVTDLDSPEQRIAFDDTPSKALRALAAAFTEGP